MGIETATFVTDLVNTNPGSSDLRNQGDDHLRLLKTVLQSTFPTASKAFYNPTSAAKSADFTVVASDMNKIFVVDTTAGAVTATLPTLASGDAGWKCSIIKSNTGVNPVFVAPPSGSLTSGPLSLTKTRRSVPGAKIDCIWSGTAWVVTRAIHLPVGSCIEFHGSTLPAGYEWPSGQTLSSSANYPDYNGAMGTLVTLDKRGRIGIPLDNLGGSLASRLVGGIITGTAVGNVGGTDTVTLSSAQIPSHTHAVFLNLVDGGHSHTFPGGVSAIQYTGASAGGGGTLAGTSTISGTASVTTGITGTVRDASGGGGNANVTAANAGGGGSHSNLQPSIMVTQILVVE
jgi:microcystin-dependent protein